MYFCVAQYWFLFPSLGNEITFQIYPPPKDNFKQNKIQNFLFFSTKHLFIVHDSFYLYFTSDFSFNQPMKIVIWMQFQNELKGGEEIVQKLSQRKSICQMATITFFTIFSSGSILNLYSVKKNSFKDELHILSQQR